MFRPAALLLLLSVRLFACDVATVSGKDLVRGDTVAVDAKAQAKGMVVVFLSSHCPCSKSHEPVLKTLAERFKGFAFIGVNSNADEEEAEAKKYFTAAALPFPIVRDPESKLANCFGALKTPHAYVVGRDGRVLFSGGVDDSHLAETATESYLKDALSAVDEGKKPPREKVRSLGCAIRRA